MGRKLEHGGLPRVAVPAPTHPANGSQQPQFGVDGLPVAHAAKCKEQASLVRKAAKVLDHRQLTRNAVVATTNADAVDVLRHTVKHRPLSKITTGAAPVGGRLAARRRALPADF